MQFDLFCANESLQMSLQDLKLLIESNLFVCSDSRLLQGAEYLELKKPIKPNFGGGVKEFIFEEQEFYDQIENEEKFLTSQERQSIIYEMLNELTCGEDSLEETVIIAGRKVPSGRKLSMYREINQVELTIHTK